MKLVVAINDKESAKVALDNLLASKYGADTQVYLVHAIVPGFADAPVAGIPDVVENERVEEQGILDEMTAKIKEKIGASVSTEIAYGEAAEIIANVCKRVDADEAIVPSHHRHGFSKLWFGSVAEEIIEAAPCAVLVLKMPDKTK